MALNRAGRRELARKQRRDARRRVVRRAAASGAVIGLGLGGLAIPRVDAGVIACPVAGDPNPYHVENLGDELEDGSLRWAVCQANTQPGHQTVTFAPGLSGTINLTGGTIDITDPLTIQGPGADVITVDQTAAGNRVFVGTGGAETILISGLTVTGGESFLGAGVFGFDVDLTLDSVVITGNQSSFAGGGVAVETGSLTVLRSTISGNTAGNHGGGITADNSALLIESSTISGNDAEEGGGISVRRWDDGTSEVSIAHSTIARNEAGAVGGGVLLLDADAVLDHTIVAANSAPSGPDVLAGQGAAVEAAWSLFGQDPSGEAWFDDLGGNQVGVADPQLGGLADNGGPTPTHLPADASPAVDAGDPDFTPPPTTDQRGEERVAGGRIDIGAVEVGVDDEVPPTTTPPTTAPPAPTAPTAPPAPGVPTTPVAQPVTAAPRFAG